MVQNHIHNRPTPVPILNHRKSVPSSPSHFLKIHFNIILPSTPISSKWSLTTRSPHHNPVCSSPSPIHATFPTHPILVASITQTSSFCSLLHSPVTSPPLGPNILVSALFSNTVCPCSYIIFNLRAALKYNIIRSRRCSANLRKHDK